MNAMALLQYDWNWLAAEREFRRGIELDLVKSFEEGSYYMIHLKVKPILDPLRPDPRFADLVRRVGH